MLISMNVKKNIPKHHICSIQVIIMQNKKWEELHMIGKMPWGEVSPSKQIHVSKNSSSTERNLLGC